MAYIVVTGQKMDSERLDRCEVFVDLEDAVKYYAAWTGRARIYSAEELVRKP